MSFPQTVSDEALVKCGRCCCICHKFCGTKIELHHIKQKVYGGEDTIDNCIPLCFDCHEDMGKADPNHPRGKRYTENELKQHRDNWFKHIEESRTAVNPDRIYQSDISLFQTICTAFGGDVEDYLCNEDFRGAHPYNVFGPLVELFHNSSNPFAEFLNVEMEKARGTLMSYLCDFLDYRAMYTFPEYIGSEICAVTNFWILNHKSRHTEDNFEDCFSLFESDAMALNAKATDLWNNYCEFVRQGRRYFEK